MNSPDHQKHLDALAARFSKLTKKELCRRIAEAITQQDSCGRCEADTIKAILQTGTDGLIVCAKCCDQILAVEDSDGSHPV